MDQPLDGTMLTTSQLADVFQVSVSTVKRWRATGRIAPDIATGRIVRYRWPVEVEKDPVPRSRPLKELPSFDREATVIETSMDELPALYADAIAGFMASSHGPVAVALMPMEGRNGEAHS